MPVLDRYFQLAKPVSQLLLCFVKQLSALLQLPRLHFIQNDGRSNDHELQIYSVQREIFDLIFKKRRDT